MRQPYLNLNNLLFDVRASILHQETDMANGGEMYIATIFIIEEIKNEKGISDTLAVLEISSWLSHCRLLFQSI